VNERAGPAEAGFFSAAIIVKASLIGIFQQLVLLSKRPDLLVAGLQLVIANENGRAVGAGKCRHAIVFAGNKKSVIHAIALPREGLVSKSLGQIENLFRIALERQLGGFFAGGGAAGDVFQPCESDGDDAGVAQKIAAGKSTHGLEYTAGGRCAHPRNLRSFYDWDADQCSNLPSISRVTERGVSRITSSRIFRSISPSWPVATLCRNGTVAARSQIYLMSAPL